MATHRELISYVYVRFQLEQLGAKNAHHDFEHLCRHLARLRICSNILPATGPVSAGGDQGRDAETFRTYLSGCSATASTFVGLVSSQPIAFACTIQKKDGRLKKKIKDDIQKILASGQPVGSIHFFLSADVTSSWRHEVEVWARNELGADLFIIDGQAISEMLAERDTFWIATEFLDIQSDMYPVTPSDGVDTWYGELLESWRESHSKPLTYANFAEVKSGLRQATFAPDHRHDLAFWLSKIEVFVSGDTVAILQYRSIYEIAVASLRGLGTMEGHESRLRIYFGGLSEDFNEFEQLSDLEDAAVLIHYCLGAVAQNAVRLAKAEVEKWRALLVTEVDRRLALAPGPGTECALLHTHGYLGLINLVMEETDAHPSTFESWLRLTELVHKAPLFPLEGV